MIPEFLVWWRFTHPVTFVGWVGLLLLLVLDLAIVTALEIRDRGIAVRVGVKINLIHTNHTRSE